MADRWERITVIGYNLGDGRDTLKDHDFERLGDLHPDAILACEVADRHAVLGDFAPWAGYVLHQGDREGQAKVATLVRKDRRVDRRGYWFCAPRTRVGAWGAGPDHSATRWIAWDRTRLVGRPVTFGSSHYVPSVQRPAKGVKARVGKAARLGVFTMHVAAEVAWLMSRRGVRICYHDTNATPDFPLLLPLRAVATVIGKPSFGHRAIDLFAIRGHGWRLVSIRALGGFSSDHKPVELVIEVRARKERRS